MDSYWTNRSLCSVLEEMRACHKTRNYSPMIGLIEEAQVLGNRMEAGLNDKKDLRRMSEEWSEMRAKLKELTREIKAAEKKLGKKDVKSDSK